MPKDSWLRINPHRCPESVKYAKTFCINGKYRHCIFCLEAYSENHYSHGCKYFFFLKLTPEKASHQRSYHLKVKATIQTLTTVTHLRSLIDFSQLTGPEWNSWSPPPTTPKPAVPKVLPISATGNCILPAAQAKNLSSLWVTSLCHTSYSIYPISFTF